MILLEYVFPIHPSLRILRSNAEQIDMYKSKGR